MREKLWPLLVDVVAVVWLAAFAVEITTSSELLAEQCRTISLVLLPVFVLDLLVLFRQADDARSFLKQRWFDILIVIPYFRLFRALKFTRVLRALRLVNLAKFLGITRAVQKTKRVARSARKTGTEPLGPGGSA